MYAKITHFKSNYYNKNLNYNNVISEVNTKRSIVLIRL